MTRIAILPLPGEKGRISYRAVAHGKQSEGKTAGQALDAMTAQLPNDNGGMVAIVQNLSPDQFFNAEQQQRLVDLMARWRTARDQGSDLPSDEQAELHSLVEGELRAATARSAALVHFMVGIGNLANEAGR